MNYKDQDALRKESEEGRRLGFDGKVRPSFEGKSDADGKQAIHPNQIETIHSAFAPNPKGMPTSNDHKRNRMNERADGRYPESG